MTNNTFVLHEHVSQHHHFDFRLERDGVLASWAVPKGLPEKAGERRLAIQVEDHPLSYGSFEGTIPEGEYGAGEVKIADAGTYETLEWTTGRIEVVLHGKTHAGKYVLLRFTKAGEKNWLVLKGKDA
ncbi:MAG: DNA polymerase ligase N-terminal domain-containing protein [Methanoregula sp.]|jgi:bifunctional non-homologous end joining protein LigD